jgi:hypothetical protein
VPGSDGPTQISSRISCGDRILFGLRLLLYLQPAASPLLSGSFLYFSMLSYNIAKH